MIFILYMKDLKILIFYFMQFKNAYRNNIYLKQIFSIQITLETIFVLEIMN